MKELITGIWNLYNNTANTFKVNTGGRFWFANAPQEETFPFACYYIITSNYDFLFKAPTASGSNYENVTIQINIYSNESSANEIATLVSYCQSLFDFSSPTVTGYTVSTFEREWTNIEWLPEESVWQASIQYRVLLIK